MHLAIVIAILSYTLIFRRKDLKNWEKYHSTMIYIAMGNLLYNFIYSNHLLWKLNPDFLLNLMASEILYTFIVLPLSALLYLSGMPEDSFNKVVYTAKYIIMYILVEFILHRYGRIIFNYGWNIWWSLAWDIMMFPMLALHHRKPLIAYLCSIAAVLTVILLFPLI